MVITQDNIIVTQIVVNGDTTNVPTITMPETNVNSVLVVEGADTQSVVVGNLDKEADSKAEEEKNVYVVMTVEKEEKQELPETAASEEKNTQDAIEAIETVAKEETVTETIKASDVNLEYLNITVEKYVTTSALALSDLAAAKPTETITQTNNVIEILVPYDLNKKENVKVYRYHNDVATVLEKLESKPTDSYVDGKYYVDRDNNLIYIYTQKFSTYGISYTKYVEPAPTPIIISGGSYSEPAKVITWANCPKDSSCPMAEYSDLIATQWYHDGIHWALAEGVMNGFPDKSFRPSDETTRAQFIVMLYRLAGSPAVQGATGYTDTPYDWYANAIAWAKENNILAGVSASKFSPNTAIAREDIALALYNYAKYKGIDVSSGENTNILSFDDALSITPGKAPAIQWAVAEGIMQGDNQNKLLPKDGAKRSEAAALLQRYFTK